MVERLQQEEHRTKEQDGIGRGCGSLSKVLVPQRFVFASVALLFSTLSSHGVRGNMCFGGLKELKLQFLALFFFFAIHLYTDLF